MIVKDLIISCFEPVYIRKLSLGDSEGQGSLTCCSPWVPKESDTTEQLHFHFHALEKEMATHSSVLAWRIPGTGEPGGLPGGLTLWGRIELDATEAT